MKLKIQDYISIVETRCQDFDRGMRNLRVHIEPATLPIYSLSQNREFLRKHKAEIESLQEALVEYGNLIDAELDELRQRCQS